MTSRERVVAAINHKQPDRIPIDIGGTLATTIHQALYGELRRRLGVTDKSTQMLELALQTAIISEEMLNVLHGDVVGIYSKPPKGWKMVIDAESNSYVDEWGIRYKMPRDGWYFEMVDHPLKDATLASLENYDWPDPYDEGRFEGIEERAKYFFNETDFAATVGCTFGGGILQDGAWLVGFEKWFSSLANDPPLVEKIMDKVLGFHLGYWDAMLSRIGKYVQVVVLGDDLGTQNSLFISPEMYRTFIKPRHKKLVDAIKSKADVKVLLHSDGAIRKIIPDIIDCGVDILNPIQVSAKGMGDTRALKEEFGDKLVFWGGGCDTQGVLPFGNPEDVRAEVIRRINDLKPNGGFVFAPVHNIQPDVPVENVLTLYKTALEFAPYDLNEFQSHMDN
jgi:uroporphyrinogen decarboxylase